MAGTMIKGYLEQLFQELSLGPVPAVDEQKLYRIKLGELEVAVRQLDPGCYLASTVAPMPTKKKEDFLLMLMKANFLGQGTGGATLGLKEDESFLTLSLGLPYEMNYKMFKESLEEFTNFLDYWKKETARHEVEAD